MTVGLYQKRPVTVEAVQWTGDNLEEIVAFTHDAYWNVDQQALWVVGVRVEEGDFIVRDASGHFRLWIGEYFLTEHKPVVGD